MLKFANIVTDNKFTELDNCNVVKSFGDIIPELPTLIIGWKKALSIFPDMDILEWKIRDNVYWTYGKREKNYRYQDDVPRFMDTVISLMRKNIKYEFFNILTESPESKKKMIDKIKSDFNKSSFLRNDMLYLYFEDEKKVYGISLRDISYEGGNPSILLKLIYSTPSVKVIGTMEELPYEIKKRLFGCGYLIPYIFNC